ncbi:aminoacyl-tRNA hydrolase [Candidatus Falkowbacteria bacterium]|nr:aminoacyl-tRNA hydrolase [Candidatus Falkowbacteria bacterium]
MKLIIGLGNPGEQYKNTWHNMGFLTVDELKDRFEFENFKEHKKLKSEISIGKIGREKIILVKPQTFMNKSGLAAALLKNYFKIKIADIIIVHDDVDLPLGKIRLAKNSSAGGHNGIKSIIQSLGTKNFIQLKIGIYQDKAKLVSTTKFVLDKISQKEKPKINGIIKKVAVGLATVIEDSLEKAMNEFN